MLSPSAFVIQTDVTNRNPDLKVKDRKHQLGRASGGTGWDRKLLLMEANVMSVRLTSSPCALLDSGGASGAIVTRRLIFPSLVTAALPKGTDAAGPAVRVESAALLPQL